MRRWLQPLMKCLRDPALPLHQFREIISALPGRIPQNLYEQVQAIAQGYASVLDALRFYCEGQDGFLATEMHEAVERCLLELKPQDRAQLNATLATAGLPRFLQAFKAGSRLFPPLPFPSLPCLPPMLVLLVLGWQPHLRRPGHL